MCPSRNARCGSARCKKCVTSWNWRHRHGSRSDLSKEKVVLAKFSRRQSRICVVYVLMTLFPIVAAGPVRRKTTESGTALAVCTSVSYSNASSSVTEPPGEDTNPGLEEHEHRLRVEDDLKLYQLLIVGMGTWSPLLRTEGGMARPEGRVAPRAARGPAPQRPTRPRPVMPSIPGAAIVLAKTGSAFSSRHPLTGSRRAEDAHLARLCD